MTNFHESRIHESRIHPRIRNNDLLYPELSYKLQGCVFAVANKYGKGLKEKIYQRALAEQLRSVGLQFTEQKRINIYSIDSGKVLGVYVPDFVISNKIVLEIKASEFTTRQDLNQQSYYLKASIYEVGYLVNFGTPKVYIQRSIYTNDRKPFISLLTRM